MTQRSGGVLPVDKPVGPTSHDVVARARRALGVRRVGHTGTLDPFASGLLLLCVGPATRLAEYLTGLDKEYVAVARLGVSTDTLDLQGRVVSTSDAWRAVTEETLHRALEAFRGDILQVPPQFSAKKVDGVAMHRRARRGEHVTLPPRGVTIHELAIQEVVLPDIRLRVRCSSGTYVRALARDLGERLGVGAHLTELRRTRVGRFPVDQALAVDSLGDPMAVERALLKPLEALDHLPRAEVTAEQAGALGHGRAVAWEKAPDAGAVAVAWEDRLVAVASVEGHLLKPRKVFHGG